MPGPCQVHAWYRAPCSAPVGLICCHFLNDGEAEWERLRIGSASVPRSTLKSLHCLNACT